MKWKYSLLIFSHQLRSGQSDTAMQPVYQSILFYCVGLSPVIRSEILAIGRLSFWLLAWTSQASQAQIITNYWVMDFLLCSNSCHFNIRKLYCSLDHFRYFYWNISADLILFYCQLSFSSQHHVECHKLLPDQCNNCRPSDVNS